MASLAPHEHTFSKFSIISIIIILMLAKVERLVAI